eukprot:CAMPEP_0115071812 /NCGR_PEP_ID=MMETSP0227-20121206/13883_1 /TAXON_ID=89957 /ORGANISM="Polarella glacialis, Strain CCMP 1383" /LENGTH=296 /DNA_ID=CAMNT_0002458491 /DNA_START=210 /DNA_END=1100 /DNA_ORIENTATION=-
MVYANSSMWADQVPIDNDLKQDLAGAEQKIVEFSANTFEEDDDDKSTRQKASTPRFWALVWVHEKCHKPENVELRTNLVQLVQKASGGAVCIKKAQKFQEWLLTNTLPYVLLTDWREAKPCLESIEEQGLQPPARVVIVAESPTIHARASVYFKPHPSNRTGNVRVTSSLGAHAKFVADCLSSIHQLSATKAMNALSPAALEEDYEEDEEDYYDEEYEAEGWTTGSEFSEPLKPLKGAAQELGAAQGREAWEPTEPAAPVKQLPFMAVIAAMLKDPTSALAVAELLESCQPQYYDD